MQGSRGLLAASAIVEVDLGGADPLDDVAQLFHFRKQGVDVGLLTRQPIEMEPDGYVTIDTYDDYGIEDPIHFEEWIAEPDEE